VRAIRPWHFHLAAGAVLAVAALVAWLMDSALAAVILAAGAAVALVYAKVSRAGIAD